MGGAQGIELTEMVSLAPPLQQRHVDNFLANLPTLMYDPYIIPLILFILSIL